MGQHPDPEFPLGDLVAMGLLSACSETPCHQCGKPSRACYESKFSSYAFCTVQHFREFINEMIASRS